MSSRGESIETFGRGIYENDSVFKGAGHRGTDAVTFFLAVPFVIAMVLLWRRGSASAGLLATGAFAYFPAAAILAELGCATRSRRRQQPRRRTGRSV